MTVLWVLAEGRTVLHRVCGWVRGELGWAGAGCSTQVHTGSNGNPGGLWVLDSEHRTCLGDRRKQWC